jgi:endonuclease-3 related protein
MRQKENRTQKAQNQIAAFYATLFRAWGKQHWWPAQSRFEVIVGAYLTQNTAWTNVEQALKQLRQAGVLNVPGIRRTPIEDLEKLVRSAGYFRQKARSLKNFVEFLDARYAGSLHRLFAQSTEELREQLLSLKGVGPETADSILLYAGNHPVFVVDTYTRRILDRHGLLPATAKYDEVRLLFQRALTQNSVQITAQAEPGLDSNPVAEAPQAHKPSRVSRAHRDPRAQIYNEMHGLIVQVGKRYCLKSKALCEECPLGKFLPKK